MKHIEVNEVSVSLPNQVTIILDDGTNLVAFIDLEDCNNKAYIEAAYTIYNLVKTYPFSTLMKDDLPAFYLSYKYFKEVVFKVLSPIALFSPRRVIRRLSLLVSFPGQK